jgi:hypothetical protein
MVFLKNVWIDVTKLTGIQLETGSASGGFEQTVLDMRNLKQNEFWFFIKALTLKGICWSTVIEILVIFLPTLQTSCFNTGCESIV